MLGIHDHDSHADCFGNTSATMSAMPYWQNLSQVDFYRISEDVGALSELWFEV